MQLQAAGLWRPLPWVPGDFDLLLSSSLLGLSLAVLRPLLTRLTEAPAVR